LLPYLSSEGEKKSLKQAGLLATGHHPFAPSQAFFGSVAGFFFLAKELSAYSNGDCAVR